MWHTEVVFFLRFVLLQPENVRRQSVAQMIGGGISRVLGGLWRSSSGSKVGSPSTDTITTIPSNTERTSTTSAKLSRESMAGISGMIRRRLTQQQVNTLLCYIHVYERIVTNLNK
jgi:hypothetical protein